MTSFLRTEIAAAKHITPAEVDLHIIDWQSPLILSDLKSCDSCEQTRYDVWAHCNKEQFKISSTTPLIIVDYEKVVADYYVRKKKPKHCDFVISGDIADGHKRIALCDLTCQKEKLVNNPAPSIKYPAGKREYAWTQMGDTVTRWQTKASYAAMIGQYAEKIFIFGWRDSDVPKTTQDQANKAMTDFNLSTTAATAGPVSFGRRGDFELIQIKYPTTYNW